MSSKNLLTKAKVSKDLKFEIEEEKVVENKPKRKKRKISSSSDNGYIQSTLRLPKENIRKIDEIAFKKEVNKYEVVEHLLVYGLEQGIEPTKLRADKLNRNYNIRIDIKEQVFDYLDDSCSIGDFVSSVISHTGGKINVHK